MKFREGNISQKNDLLINSDLPRLRVFVASFAPLRNCRWKEKKSKEFNRKLISMKFLHNSVLDEQVREYPL
jgi:hypothetical protein